jgi:hypothetical protein
MISCSPALCLREKRGPAPPQGESPEIQDAPAVKVEREITCAACGAGITHEKERMSVGGAHVHTFKNPSAIDFTIGCFANAHGCRPVGERSTVWTWFPGFAWQVSLCARCGAHLGWSFEGEASRFWGLILDKLAP